MKTTPEIHEKLIAKLRSDIDLANARLSAGYYYASLPLAVTDAVFSIGVRYETVVNSVHHLARRAGWEVYRPLGSPYLDPGRQHTISELLAEFKKAFDPTEVFGNRGYANPAAARPIPKAILVQQVAGVLAANGIENFNDFAAYPKLEALEETLRSLPAMSSGVAVSYLGMLCGNDENIKPDRHIHAFIRMASGNSGLVISNAEAVSLMQEAAHSLAVEDGLRHITPRLLDHAVWSVQRNVRGSRKIRTKFLPESRPAGETAYAYRSAPAQESASSASFQGALQMNQFWPFCVRGGTTPSGLEFRVDQQERLHIISPRSANKNYKISRHTVAAYLERLHEVRFRRDHGWFCNVADFALHQLI